MRILTDVGNFTVPLASFHYLTVLRRGHMVDIPLARPSLYLMAALPRLDTFFFDGGHHQSRHVQVCGHL
jgi:hypothetical protein